MPQRAPAVLLQPRKPPQLTLIVLPDQQLMQEIKQETQVANESPEVVEEAASVARAKEGLFCLVARTDAGELSGVFVSDVEGDGDAVVVGEVDAVDALWEDGLHG